VSEHLPLLKDLFPDVLVLTIEQVAKVLQKAKQTVYNEISQGRFPCKITADKKVSIIELARYLDTNIAYTPPKPVEGIKRGRKPKNHLPDLLAFWSAVEKEIGRLNSEELSQKITTELGEFPKPGRVGAGKGL